MAVGGWGESQGSISPALFALKSAMCGFLCTSNHGAELLHGTIVGYERGERGEGGKVGGFHRFCLTPHALVALSWVGSKVGCIGKGSLGGSGAQTVAGWTGEAHQHPVVQGASLCEGHVLQFRCFETLGNCAVPRGWSTAATPWAVQVVRVSIRWHLPRLQRANRTAARTAVERRRQLTAALAPMAAVRRVSDRRNGIVIAAGYTFGGARPLTYRGAGVVPARWEVSPALEGLALEPQP